MAYINPTVADFKTYFSRDFPFQPDPPADPPGVVEPDKYVQDSDIDKARSQTDVMINQGLFTSQASYTIGYNLLCAHYLVQNLRQSAAGLNGSFQWPAGSKSVGSVSISQAIPQKILNNPIYAWFTTSNYGMEYLVMIYPMMRGYMKVVAGHTHA